MLVEDNLVWPGRISIAWGYTEKQISSILGEGTAVSTDKCASVHKTDSEHVLELNT